MCRYYNQISVNNYKSWYHDGLFPKNSNQVCNLKKSCFQTLRKIAKIRNLLTQKNLKTIVNSLVVSCLDYCNALYYNNNNNKIR